MVRVKGDVDTVYANWLGYGESKEEVALENGLGYVETEGHKYQLGAKWNKKVVRSYFAYDATTDEWVPVLYKGTVKVGKTEMKIVEPKNEDDEVPADMTFGNQWVWTKDYYNTDTVKPGTEKEVEAAKEAIEAGMDSESEDSAAEETKEDTTAEGNGADPDSTTGTTTGSDAPAGTTDNTDSEEEEEGETSPVDGETVAAGLPKQPKKAGSNSNTNGQSIVTEKPYYQVIDGVLYVVDGLFDENDLLVSANIDAFNSKDIKYDKDGNVIKNASKIGWEYMVPFYQFYEQNTGKDSNGAPNYAWIVEAGAWTNTYTRAGKVVKSVKTEENTDYFKTGLAGNKGKVTWESRKTDGGTKWYTSSIVEDYAEGDIAEAVAYYNVNGALTGYDITYRTGEDEFYTIAYDPSNKPVAGSYEGKDFDGNDITATANSLKTWRDDKTGKLTNQVELDWGLTALKDWTNPPRLAK